MTKGIHSLFALFSVAALAGCSSQPAEQTSASASPNNTQINITVNKKQINVNAPAFDPKALLQEMYQNEQRLSIGSSSDYGNWIITRHSVPLRDGRTVVEAAAIAEIRARKAIAATLGSNVTAQDLASETIKSVNGKTEIESVMKSFVQIDVNELLRGITLLHQEVKETAHGKVLLSAYYVTTTQIDATAELKKQLKAAPPGVVRASGYSVIQNNRIPRAKRDAVQAALRNAVEQVMGTTVIGQSQLMDNDKAKAKVISQTAGNVKQYRIVKEGTQGINYQVIVNAEIEEKSLLDNYAAIVRSMGNPGFLVNTSDPDLHTALTGFLADLGFMITTDDKIAQFIVNADCRYISVKDSHYGEGIQIDLELRLISKKNSQQLFSFGNTPRLTSSYSGNFHQIRQSAAKKAFKTMRKKLHEKLNKVVMDWVLNGRPVDVVFNNFTGDDALVQKLVKSFEGVPCAKYETFEFKGNKLTVKCAYVGPTADFNEFLFERIKRDIPQLGESIKTTEVGLNSLVIDCNLKR